MMPTVARAAQEAESLPRAGRVLLGRHVHGFEDGQQDLVRQLLVRDQLVELLLDLFHMQCRTRVKVGPCRCATTGRGRWGEAADHKVRPLIKSGIPSGRRHASLLAMNM